MDRKRVSKIDLKRVEKPIKVFISSDQDEFDDLRKNLKNQIDLEHWRDRWIFEGVLVDKSHGDIIPKDIDVKLDSASIYVVIMGDIDTWWTVEELKKAWVRGIPILIYDYRKKSGTKEKSKSSKYFDKLWELGVRFQVPDVDYRGDQDLIDQVLNDLPEKLADVADKYLQVRKTVARKEWIEHKST